VVANEATNHVLKEFVFEEDRPLRNLPGRGMPSAHAQSMAFVTIFVICFIRWRKERFLDQHESHLLITGLVLDTVVVSFARVYLGYHTVRQVVVGLGFGTCFGLAWMACAALMDTKMQQLLLSSPIAGALHLKDSSLRAGFLQFERRSCHGGLHPDSAKRQRPPFR